MIQSKMALILTTLILSSCASEIIVFAPVEIPHRTYYPNVTRTEIKQCPEYVRKSVYINLKSRDQYIETLLDVIEIHHGNITE